MVLEIAVLDAQIKLSLPELALVMIPDVVAFCIDGWWPGAMRYSKYAVSDVDKGFARDVMVNNVSLDSGSALDSSYSHTKSYIPILHDKPSVFNGFDKIPGAIANLVCSLRCKTTDFRKYYMPQIVAPRLTQEVENLDGL